MVQGVPVQKEVCDVLSRLIRKRRENLARENKDLAQQLETVKWERDKAEGERDKEKARADCAEARVAEIQQRFGSKDDEGRGQE